MHLTNDAVQIKSDDYGKYEAGNKLSYADFQKYLDSNFSELNVDFERDIVPQIKCMITHSVRSVYSKIDPKRRCHCMEIFGYDFMLDENFKVILIEANTNPCLEITSTLLSRIIPAMLDDTFRFLIL